MLLVVFKFLGVYDCVVKVCSVESIKVGYSELIDEDLKYCMYIYQYKRYNR
jgi:hypothetical protein